MQVEEDDKGEENDRVEGKRRICKDEEGERREGWKGDEKVGAKLIRNRYV